MHLKAVFFFLFIALLDISHSQSTQVQYLSGTDKDHTVAWQFTCTSGRNSNVATTIAVPSNWELQGFGHYSYQSDPSPAEQGLYSYSFTVPTAWNGMSVYIVFEGVQTDAAVSVNSKSAGATHQGGFYRFRYDISSLLNYGASNQLDVTVSRASANASVNNAERHGDYWNFSGIYRPVYLTAYPKQHIDRMAINAKADGSIAVNGYLAGITTATSVQAQVQTLNGTAVGAPFTDTVASGQTTASLSSSIASPNLWTSETPNLYVLVLSLKAADGTVIHTTQEQFGFRTIEVRAGQGIFVNNQSIKIKGSCRHSFWPDAGRTTSRALSLSDALLMKQMNMNAVRMSHYPPDTHFLEICDSLGIYVLDELGGWQAAYDTPTGTTLVHDMVARDVNHPCVIIWDNGNEGGWNTALDALFGQEDIQKRNVVHPGGGSFNNINDPHYNDYTAMQNNVNGNTLYMPTEFLHGLYDGGAGAGLYDYWNIMGTKAMSAGGFLWAFVDEGVVRTDQNNIVDTHGNMAPDGILGPYRQKEGSFYTIKEVWSPAYIDMDTLPSGFSGSIPIANRYDFTNLNQCAFTWKLVDFNFFGGDTGRVVAASGAVTMPSIAPHAQGALSLALPTGWQNHQGLLLTGNDPSGKEIFTWSWMIQKPAAIRATVVDTALSPAAASFTENASQVTVTAGGVVYVFNKSNAQLAGITHGGHAVSLTNGPALASGSATLTSITTTQQGSSVFVNAAFSGNFQYVRWTVFGSGLCKLSYAYSLTGSDDYCGVNFNYPETKVKGLRWLGKGPYHAWKNRMKGGSYAIWHNLYGDPIPGASWIYPEFKGYFANTQWATLETSEDTLQFIFDDPNMFYRNFTPQNGASAGNTAAAFPGGNISFLQGISAMGDKFNPATAHGPQGALNAFSGTKSATVYLHFGALTNPVALRGSLPGPSSDFALRQRAAQGLEFYAPQGGNIKLTLYDIRGVSHIVYDAYATQGWHAMGNGPPLHRGVYIAQLNLNGKTLANKTCALEK